jgi:hypothetical protein
MLKFKEAWATFAADDANLTMFQGLYMEPRDGTSIL